ncbi:MAG: c-type cytochrome domain-containing protein [Planctomycetota bacterium]|jgi:uncharacterized membrane protein/mono/diheme cytochrome c family protein
MLADQSPWVEAFGLAHPMLLHAPLGLLPALALFEFGPLLLRREPQRGAVQALAVLNGIAGALAMASGLVLGGSHRGELVTEHKIGGIVLGGLCLLVMVLSFRSGRLPMRLALLGAFGTMFYTGHKGGEITHGKELENALRRLFGASEPTTDGARPPKPLQPAATDTATTNGATAAAAATDFATLAQPVLERVCVSCHNPDKRKGELLLTTREGIEKGGENGAVVVAGKPDESLLVTRCELPADHDDHMPPKDKKQPTAEEIAALRRWVLAGAKF